jgi:ribosomal-protein-serine acetyltransferase
MMFRYVLGEELSLERVETWQAEGFAEAVGPHLPDLCRDVPWLEGLETADDWRHWIWLRRDLEAHDQGLACSVWSQGQLGGFVFLDTIDGSNLNAMLAYWLLPPARGRGVATRACAGLIDYAFGPLGLVRLYLRVVATNSRSRALAERLGFTHEGTLRSCEATGEGFCDHALYGLLAPEWTARHVEPL